MSTEKTLKLLFLCCLMFAASCTGNTPVSDNAGDASAEARPPHFTDGLPSIAGLDERAASAEYIQYDDLDDLLLVRSENTEFEIGDLIYKPDGLQLCYAIWTAKPGEHERVGAEIEIDLMDSGEAWIGIADYSVGRWIFQNEPAETINTIQFDEAKQSSPNDNIYFVVVAVPGGNLSVDVIGITTNRVGWQVVTVDASGTTGFDCSIAEINGRAAISYRTAVDSTEDILKYAIARRDLPLEFAHWTRLSLVEDERAGFDSSLALITGEPAIAYHDIATDQLKFMRSSTASGDIFTDWDGPVIVDIDSPGNLGANCSLAEVNFRPAIAYSDQTNDGLRYVQCVDSGGLIVDNWAQNSVAVDYTSDVSSISLEIVDGNPAISYVRTDTDTVHYARSTTVDGKLAADWTQSADLDFSEDVQGDTSLLVADGRPAVFYRDNENDFLTYEISLNSTGEDTSKWTQGLFIETVRTINTGIASSLVEGRPAVAYSGQFTRELVYSRSHNASGISLGPLGWPKQVVFDADADFEGGRIGHTDMAVINGRPVICFYHQGPDDLKCAFLLEE